MAGANVKLIIAAMLIVALITGCEQINKIYPSGNNQTNNTSIPQNQTQVQPEPLANNTNASAVPPPIPNLIIPPVHTGNLTLYYISVGQGDAAFIVGPENKTMLIDCGPTSAASTVVELVRNLGFATIDAAVISHQHEDHMGGCPVEFFKLKPKVVYDNGHIVNTQVYRDYVMSKPNNSVAVSTDGLFDFDLVSSNFIVAYDDGHGFSENENDNSLLVRLLYKNTTFLFTGDCESDCESRVINSDMSAGVLKVGHHGSKTSSSVLFLNAVRPSIAVISSGAGNQYGHPHAETLEKLNQRGVQIYRTDTDGTIVITTDGKTIGVEKVKG